jgi:hypothetical protein
MASFDREYMRGESVRAGRQMTQWHVLEWFNTAQPVRLGTMLGQLLAEFASPLSSAPASASQSACTDDSCPVRMD